MSVFAVVPVVFELDALFVNQYLLQEVLLVESLLDVSPTVRSCPRCGQSMVIKQKKDGSG